LIQPTINWYHATLGHCGTSRLCSTIRTHFHVPKLNEHVSALVANCEACQKNKFSGPGYGHLPPRNDVGVPWEEVAVDLIGPWKIRLPVGQLQILALTVVDVTTTLSEIIRIDNRSSAHVSMQFENSWLARYPRPLRCVHDQGPEFVGTAFQTMLATNGVQAVPTSVKNPQANAVCERMHKTVQDMLNTTLRHNYNDVATVLELVDSCIASAIRALRAATHHTMQISPGAIVFHRDRMLPIPIHADYNLLRERRQAVIDENNRRANLRRRFRDYHIDDQVLLVVKDPATLGEKTAGPYRVHLVHVNGTLTIERDPGIYERVNIRRLKPFHPRN
jgi:transposase InsO family protein